MNTKLIEKYINIAISQNLKMPNIFGKLDKITKAEFFIKGDIESLYITNSTRIYKINMYELITDANFINSIAKYFYKFWYYRDINVTRKDIINQQAKAIYNKNIENYILEYLKLEND